MLTQEEIELLQKEVKELRAMHAKIKAVQRRDSRVEACDCCGTSVDYEADDHGPVVLYKDLEDILNKVPTK